MTKADNPNVDRFEIEIDCPWCDSGPTKRSAWADTNGLDRMEVESVAELRIDDFRQLAKYGEGGIDGECQVCAAPATAAQRLAELGGRFPALAAVPRRCLDREG